MGRKLGNHGVETQFFRHGKNGAVLYSQKSGAALKAFASIEARKCKTEAVFVIEKSSKGYALVTLIKCTLLDEPTNKNFAILPDSHFVRSGRIGQTMYTHRPDAIITAEGSEHKVRLSTERVRVIERNQDGIEVVNQITKITLI